MSHEETTFAKVREIAEEAVERGDPDQTDGVLIAQHFLDLLDVAQQAASAGFSSQAANGILQSAVDCYTGTFSKKDE